MSAGDDDDDAPTITLFRKALFRRVLERKAVQIVRRQRRPPPLPPRRDPVFLPAHAWVRLYDEARDAVDIDPAVLRDYEPHSGQTYGEAMPRVVQAMLAHLALTPRDLFVDLGSGIGNVVLQVATQTGARCLGVEMRAELDDLARRLAAHVQRRMAGMDLPMGEVVLLHGDALQLPDAWLAEASVVFMNNVRFEESMQQALLDTFARVLPRGARLVTTKHVFPRIDPSSWRYREHPIVSRFPPPWPCMEVSGPDAASWTSSALAFHVYTVGGDDTPPPPM
jgi:H3 lysine-79-specific histone-lysine N-methyltransferase